jgi:anthranilate synthase component 1
MEPMKIVIDGTTDIPALIQEFSEQFKSEKNKFKFINNGLLVTFL